MTKKLKKPRAIKIDLPYWPSQKFIAESIALLREKGLDGTEADLKSFIHEAYWKRRAQILAEIHVPK